jgi:hypothetical protein
VTEKKRGLTANPLDRIAPDTLFRVTAPTALGEGEPSRYRLEDIRPDPCQARRVLPEDLAGKLTAGEMGPGQAIEGMVGRAEEDPAVAKRLAGLRKLATSIQKHGLINPVTLRRVGAGLIIETGERRYWAHWLLVLDGHQEFMDIRGERVPEDTNVTARQLIENWRREDLNAVEKARGLWALRYELSGMKVNHGTPFPTNEGISDGEGVNHGTPPLVTWVQVEETLGISKRYRIFLLHVLDLCDKAQEIIAHYGLAERLVRPVTQKVKGRPNLQATVLQKVAESYDRAAEKGNDALKMGPDDVARLVDQLLRSEVEPEPPAPSRPSYARDFKRGLRASLRVFEKVSKETELDEVLAELVTTPDYAEVGKLAVELEPLVSDLAERWRAAMDREVTPEELRR